MKFSNRFNRTALCLAQTVLLLAGNMPYVFAATVASDSLDGFEKSVFGETHSKLSENERLKDLEINLFGKTHNGSPAVRISEISKALGGGKNDNLLLPAMAPQMDFSSSHKINTAPSIDTDADATDPVVTASGDAEKDTLRNAMRLYSQGKTDEAEEQFRRALSLNKNSADAYYNLGVIAEGKGDLQSALNNYRSAARINPSDTELASAISSLETKLQDKVNSDSRQRQSQLAAAQDLQQRRKTDNLKQMIETAATAYKSQDYDKAISNLQYVSQQAPDDGDVLYALGQAYKAKGDYSRARNAYNSAIATDTSNSMYKDALANLNQVANSSSGSGGYGGPPTAPNRHNKPGQLTGFSGSGSSYSNGNLGNNNGGNDTGNGGGSSAGGLTPFSGVANGSGGLDEDQFANSTPGGVGYGYVSSSGRGSSLGGISGLGGLGGLSGLASLGGLGLGMGMGTSMLGGGVRFNNGGSYGRRYGGYGGGSSTRIKRAAIGGLTGAAAGAMYGGVSHGSMKSSAMKGALMGAALGLFMGGY